ncbi:Uncharacterized protein YwqG [Zunongwangia mangrovi]|uniref:Uncharacterized protein YwqG n=1 Tax=Zunongwangia mangrovi TaxID=1334022 RepID=A0A1I1N922_9FLAO|nr:YwqG family protein [Zunongwangia mangrovi]SFC94161.1 Uncharacterized protein YwqG [Zunongwangia mangrovi]
MTILSSLSGFGQNKLEKIKKYLIESSYEIENSDKLKILDLIKPTIGIKTKSKTDNEIEIGISKIGGNPDLPNDFKWPKFENEYLTFCAQYNLTELNKYVKDNSLPSKGMLYVFIFIDKEWPGFLNKKDSYKIIYIENTKNIQRQNFPKGYFQESKFKAAQIEYFEYLTLPHYTSYKVEKYFNKYEDFEYFYDSVTEFNDTLFNQNSDIFHQILGEDRSIQSTVVIDFATKILEIKTIEDYNSKKTEIDKISKDYSILLQLDCNDNNSDLSKFGGGMTIYFGIEPKNLKNRDFENVIMAFQGT